ncbi:TRIGALACTOSYLDIACYLGLYCEROL-like protein [Perilla frutescens var. hirtella]|uniref:TRIGALACTOSYLDIACYLGLYCEROL-like protein n=1 Tax=Perilla frutescens var. hirtella TaxID=608512 RepID=A0AAD4NWL3_PERFH|nr:TRIGALACTOSYLDIACYLGLYCEROL-like protein [Perilla frutescens var. hirtella]
MANLRTAMDAAFWDLNISTPQAIDGVCRAIPGDPIPLDGARASRALRFQQISLIGNGFPLGIIPSFSPSINHKELGSFALQSLIGRAVIGDWWFGLIGQFRPKKLISSIKAEVSAAEEWELPLLKDTAKHFLDKSLFALGLCTQIALTSSSSLLLTSEKHGERNNRRTKAMLFHKLPDHDITFEAAWPELFIDRKGKYWEVPESISLDCSSLVSDSGLRYRFGLHKSSGTPEAVDSVSTETPVALLPGLCAKAAFSYEQSKDFWRQKETKDDVTVETKEGQAWCPPYDIRLKDPHAAISGIIGGTCEAWLRGVEGSQDVNQSSSGTKRRGRFGADLFGSLCYTFQHGRFRNNFGDLSRIDARLDISSASAVAKKVANLFSSAQSNQPPNELCSPRLNLIFQQQVAGPIVFRVDSKFSLGSSSNKQGLQLEDLIYSLNYSLRLLGSGKVVAWFSPKRKEGMVELRLFEF